jgi:hypothetical protein
MMPLDKEIALHLIGRMGERTSLSTIIRRLQAIEASKAMMCNLIADQLINEKEGVLWLIEFIESQAGPPKKARPVKGSHNSLPNRPSRNASNRRSQVRLR